MVYNFISLVQDPLMLAMIERAWTKRCRGLFSRFAKDCACW